MTPDTVNDAVQMHEYRIRHKVVNLSRNNCKLSDGVRYLLDTVNIDVGWAIHTSRGIDDFLKRIGVFNNGRD